jgi:hypothetical protein
MLGIRAMDRRDSLLPFGVNPGVRDRAHATAYSVTTDYNARIIASGGTTLTAAQWAGTYWFVRSLIEANIWGKFQRINPLLGGLAGAVVPLTYSIGNSLDTLTNFVSGDYGDTTGLTGNGSNKYLNTTAALADPSTGAFGWYLRNSMDTSATRIPMGCRTSTQTYRALQATTPNYTCTWGTNAGASTVAGAMPTGCWHLDRSSASRLDLYLNGTSVASRTTSTTTGVIPWTIYAYAQNDTGTATGYADASLGIYWISATLTATQAAALSTIVTNYMTALGRQV